MTFAYTLMNALKAVEGYPAVAGFRSFFKTVTTTEELDVNTPPSVMAGLTTLSVEMCESIEGGTPPHSRDPLPPVPPRTSSRPLHMFKYYTCQMQPPK